MSYEKVVTLFDTAEHAEAARKNLERAGFSADDISVVGKKGLADDVIALRESSLWHRLFGKDIAEYEAKVYGKTVENGGAILTLRVLDSELAKAMGILNQHHVVDVSRRAVESGLIARSDVPAPMSPPARTLTTAVDKGEVLRLAEEQLEVGKRLVTDGTTRIRRFIVEKPVDASVTLHEEHVEIVRRAAADPASFKDVDWSDKTIEIVDTHEEPVIRKSVHLAEEVRVGTKASDRIETVHDKIRRQEVEVERVPVPGPR